ncbi:hypothetical protein CN918_30205 [Priestia megaterium]|nr:hypothetical protein CN918_30205 [Priestia megaterium]
MGHIFERNGHWSYRIDIGKTVDGKRPRHTVSGFETKELARLAMIHAERQVEEGTYFSHRMQMKEILFEWIEELDEKIEPVYKESLEDVTIRYILPYFGEWKLGDITQHAILAFFQFLTNRIPTDLSDEQMEQAGIACAKVFQFTVDQGYLYENPMENVSYLNRESPLVRFWTLQQVHDFLEVAEAEREYPLYVLLLTTGIDTHEMVSLTWKMIDFNKQTIQLTETTNERREIALPLLTSNALLNWRECLAFEEEQAENNYIHLPQLVVNQNGQLLSKQELQERFEHICRIAGVPILTLEDLRHTHAILILEKGLSYHQVASHLGHHTAQITKDLYAKYLARGNEEVKGIMDALFNA